MTASADRPAVPRLPETPAGRWVQPLRRFLEIEAAAGVILLVATAIALVLANSPWADAFAAIWKIHFTLRLGPWELDESLLHGINDGLMTLFFFVVGLEIKREIVAGELRDPRKAALPVVAALGGMIVPASLYLLLQAGQPGQRGWGIPMATDIAFVVGFLALFGRRVPAGLKILLLSLAIADDIGAVLVIAVFYSTEVSFLALGLAAIGFAITYGLNRIGVRRVPVYVVVGAAIWLAMFHSGVHPTVAGVLLGLLTPASAWVGDGTLLGVASDILTRFRGETGTKPNGHARSEMLGELALTVRESVSPLERLELALHPWVAFAIMPLFALANAGVPIRLPTLGDPIAMAVALGLMVGKPLGVVLFSVAAVQVGLARLPIGVTWKTMIGAGCLAGIGFTMSIFIAGLALEGESLDAAKAGILIGSSVSAALGCGLLVWFLPRRTPLAPASSA